MVDLGLGEIAEDLDVIRAYPTFDLANLEENFRRFVVLTFGLELVG